MFSQLSLSEIHLIFPFQNVVSCEKLIFYRVLSFQCGMSNYSFLQKDILTTFCNIGFGVLSLKHFLSFWIKYFTNLSLIQILRLYSTRKSQETKRIEENLYMFSKQISVEQSPAAARREIHYLDKTGNFANSLIFSRNQCHRGSE